VASPVLALRSLGKGPSSPARAPRSLAKTSGPLKKRITGGADRERAGGAPPLVDGPVLSSCFEVVGEVVHNVAATNGQEPVLSIAVRPLRATDGDTPVPLSMLPRGSDSLLAGHWFLSAEAAPQTTGRAYTTVTVLTDPSRGEARPAEAQQIEFLIKRYAEGRVSRAVGALGPGQLVCMSGPMRAPLRPDQLCPISVLVAQVSAVLRDVRCGGG
jgi:hypothetical protein